MSNCCGREGEELVEATVTSDKSARSRCINCGTAGRSVERQTILHHVRHENLDRVVDSVAYRFCPDPNCTVVYFGDCGARLTVGDLRELVTAKIVGDKRPICYCFGFTEGDARQEIARTGTSTLSAQISRLIKAGMCACEVRNPSGECCLGQVKQTVKRLSEEHKASVE